MMIDIFQYSNMYTLKKSIQWLADEAHVKEECGPYVTKPGGFPTIIQSRSVSDLRVRQKHTRLASASAFLFKIKARKNNI